MKRALLAIFIFSAVLIAAQACYAADAEIKLKTSDGDSKFIIKNSVSTEVFYIDSSGRLRIAPSTYPVTPIAGMIIIDSEDGFKLKWHNGNRWNYVSSAETDGVTIQYNSNGSLEVKDGGIGHAKLDIINNPPAAGQILSYDNITGKLKWNNAGIGTINGVTPGPGIGGGGSYGSVTVEAKYDALTISINSSGSLEVALAGITADRIATGAVTSSAIATSAVISEKIADGAVIGQKLATDISFSTTGNVTAESFTGKFFGSGAGITGITAEVADYSISTTKLSTSAVTAEKLTVGSYPAITGVGTLDSLKVTGAAEIGGDLSTGGRVSAQYTATQEITAAGISSSMLTKQLLRVRGSGGNVTINHIDAGLDGQIIIIRGMDDDNLVTITTGGNIFMASGISFTLGNRDNLVLYYDATDLTWFEISRDDN